MKRVWLLAALLGSSASLSLGADDWFVDVAEKSGVDFQHRSSKTSQKYLPEAMSGGVALLDYDSDGLLDIYFVNGAKLADPMPDGAEPDKSDPAFWNRLYRNLGGGAFEDVTEAAGVAGRGYGQGAAAGDFDNDGDPDLYITNVGENILYRNDGTGRFEDVTASAGVAGGGWSASAAWLDYDIDGDLDLFVSRYLDWSWQTNRWCGDAGRKERAYCHPRYFEAVPHILYRNDGGGRFTNVSATSGIASAPGKGLGVALDDFNGDRRLDIFVANDKVEQQLFLNLADGFEESALGVGAAFDGDGETYSGMGVAAGDYDDDGWPDLFVNALALQGYALYSNRDGFFDYVSAESRVGSISERHSGWGTGFLDFDNDGRLDLFVAQGHVMDNIKTTQPGIAYREPFLLMRNEGRTFVDVSALAGAAFQEPHAARGAAFGDLDNDGDIDIVINNNNEAAAILLNQAAKRNWLIVELEGTQNNRDGVGAWLTATVDGVKGRRRMAATAGSYMSSSDSRIHLGLGEFDLVERVVVEWPNGQLSMRENVAAGQILHIRDLKFTVGE